MDLYVVIDAVIVDYFAVFFLFEAVDINVAEISSKNQKKNISCMT